MNQDLLNALILPMIFSMCAGLYVFFKYPERRDSLLLNLVLMQLVGAICFRIEAGSGLLLLNAIHALVVSSLLVQHMQTPEPATVTVNAQQDQ